MRLPKRGESRTTVYIDEKGNRTERPFSLNYSSRKGFPRGKKVAARKAA